MSTQPNWFIALPVPAEGWFPDRVAGVPDRIRLFAPQDLHVTVAFLGNCGREAALRAWELAADWPDGAVEIELGEVVPMGNPRRYSALSALLLRGAEELEQGIGKCRDAMWAAADARADSRPPKAHLTLARPPWRAKPEVRDAGLQWARALDLRGVSLQVDRLALYTWSPQRPLVQFQIVEQHQLA